MKRNRQERKYFYGKAIIALLVIMLFLSVPVRESRAGCIATEGQTTMDFIVEQHELTRDFITEQFKEHENWLFGANGRFMGGHDSFFELHMLPALMMMTEQLVSAGMEQMLILGTFFDAKIQLETQQLFQKREAQARKDYQPSFDMCVIGTSARGLATADRNGEFTSFVLSQRSQDRQLGMLASNGAKSAKTEREGRIRQVQAIYCDPRDNDGKLGLLCTGGKAPANHQQGCQLHANN